MPSRVAEPSLLRGWVRGRACVGGCAKRPSSGGSPREGARSELASGAATGGGGRSAPDPDQVRLLLFEGSHIPPTWTTSRRVAQVVSGSELFELAQGDSIVGLAGECALERVPRCLSVTQLK